MRRAGIALAIPIGLAMLGVWQRHFLMLHAIATDGPPPLLDASDEGPEARWFDDYFTIQTLDVRSPDVQSLDERTFAIGEPRFYQQNFSYLIAGDERAVLFDAGPGYRDLRPVAHSLTDLPITFIPSHFHYDHVGNRVTFERVAVVDLPYLRERAPEGRLRLTFAEHLGVVEGMEAPTLEVDEWLAPGSEISLGNRSLRVLYTPGHTEDSISLLDLASGDLFSGDFLYPGPLFAFLPNSGMGDYLQGSETLLRALPESARVFGAHRTGPPGAPELARSDVEDLHDALMAIHDGEIESTGSYPRVYRVNARIDLHAEPAWLQRWTPRHPELR